MSLSTGDAMSAATLSKLFEFTYNVTKQNIQGFNHEDSLVQPQAAGNCLNWLLGHIVDTRNSILELLGEKRIWTPEESKSYVRGSEPIHDDSNALRWDKITADFDSTQERLRAGLAKLTAEELAAPLPEDKNPFGLESVAMMLGAFSFHESYHAGQIGLIRRVLGREGVIN